MTLLGGGLGHLLIREPENLRRAEGNYVGNILYGLRPGVVWANPSLYLALLALAVYAASQQVYMPYLIIYIQRYLGVGRLRGDSWAWSSRPPVSSAWPSAGRLTGRAS